MAGLGTVARDHSGKILVARWRHDDQCASMEEAEALAMLEGHGLAGRHIEKPVIVESDCSQMVQGVEANKK